MLVVSYHQGGMLMSNTKRENGTIITIFTDEIRERLGI